MKLRNVVLAGACMVLLPFNLVLGLTEAPKLMPPIPAPSIEETEHLHRLFDDYFQETIQDSPEYATILGLPGSDQRWSDLSREAVEKRRQRNKHTLAQLKHIDFDKLNDQDRLNASILLWYLKNQEAWKPFKSELMPIDQQHGPHLEASFILQIMPADTVEHYENILGRLNGIPHMLSQTIELLEAGKKAKITPPKVTLESVPLSILKQLPDNPDESPFFKPFTKIPESIPSIERMRLCKEARNIIITKVYPAMGDLHDYFITQYLPYCRTTTAMKDLPTGSAWYRQAARSYTTTRLTPGEIHQIGLSEVKRIHREMHHIMLEIGFKGNLKKFFKFMRDDPQFTFASADELLDEYRRLLTVIESNLPNLFNRFPKVPCILQPVPHYSEKTAPGAYYLMGSPKTGRPGIFFANTYDLKARPKWETEPLALHEALPGHHMQLMIALENESIPHFRVFTDSTAYIEGWGLYSEGLGKELGLYTTAYSRFGALSHELFRAIRLVVDTGLHYKGWEREKAIEYMMENSCLPEHDIIAEVDRYLVMPGQALAYKIGQMHILKLRRQAELLLGDQFDIRTFHDKLLEQGDMPLNILETYMQDWMIQQKGLKR
ncbi:MAG: DUF885 domain-containing protein [Parachlamydia sp.]|nr:DUF885 domain-containing protein [Parachlamydia sp.]